MKENAVLQFVVHDEQQPLLLGLELDGNTNELLSIINNMIPREDVNDDQDEFLIFDNFDFNLQSPNNLNSKSGNDTLMNNSDSTFNATNNYLFNNVRVEEGKNNEDESDLIFPKQLCLPTGMTIICNNMEEYKLFRTICKDQETGDFIPIVQETKPPPSVLKRMEERRKELSLRNNQNNQNNQHNRESHLMNRGCETSQDEKET
ncbi:predicted protein [Naegleria gruberi]|uniref:Predicted protein n=1 Tax=Naegleria gruberi TaxID=5762 RepID=D2V8I5_NAEGR|nr:uncharacterized protein NAEGRDRAFT_57464 [Naegleria gruberi]EFC46690.1 predicted protein [Naegleria gruberi]|eukprot:XP_002679434.1 predicted protein [Naegleria gruberi strain NEG-M]